MKWLSRHDRYLLPLACAAVVCAAAAPQDPYLQKMARVRQEVGAGFHAAIEKPFIVVSDQARADFERSRTRTIRWAVRMLKKDFFGKDPQEILTIYLFDGEESYRKHTKEFFGEEPDTPFGYYSSLHQALVMNIATGGGTLVHEIVHPFMEANFPQCPAWFDEGLGSLFEQCREEDGHITGLPNWRLPILQRGIEQGHLVPLAELLATDAAAFYADPRGMHYAEARYLLYYLQHKGKLRAFYKLFVENAKRDPSGVDSLLKVLGLRSVDQLQRGWLKFVETLEWAPSAPR